MPQEPATPSSKRRRKYRVFYCGRCRCNQQFSRRALDHGRHRSLTVSTLGLWAIVWLAKTVIYARRPWRCNVCQSRFVPSAVPRSKRKRSSEERDQSLIPA